MTVGWNTRGNRTAGIRLTGRRRWPWLLLLVPPILLGALAAQRALATPPLDLGAPIPCPSRSRLVVTVLDVSSSVIDRDGADPDGRSFGESRAVAQHLAAYPCSEHDRFGTVIFANTATELEPTDLHSMSIIRAGLRRPPASEVGSGTNLVSALEAARSMVLRFPDYSATVIVLSDMQSEQADSIGPLLSELDRHASVHLVALGDHDTSFDGQFRSVRKLSGPGRGEIAQALVAAIASSNS